MNSLNERMIRLFPLTDAQEISNFSVTLNTIFFAPTDHDFETPLYVRAQIVLTSGKIHLWDTNLKQFNCQNLLHQFPTCCINTPGGQTSINLHLRQQLAHCLAEDILTSMAGLYFQENGFHWLSGGRVCYVAGNTVLGKLEEPYIIAPSVSHLQLPTPEEGVQIFPQFLSRVKNSSAFGIAFAYSLLSGVQSVILKSGIMLQSVLYIQSPQGYGKTFLAKSTCCPYNSTLTSAPACFYDAGSTRASILKSVSAYRDLPLVVDDLCICTGSNMQRSRQELCAQIIRAAANKTTLTKQVGKTTTSESCLAGVVITAEIPMTAASELTRCIILPISEPQHNGSMHDRDLCSAIFRQYLVWFVENYFTETADLSFSYQRFLRGWNQDMTNMRTRESYFALEWVWISFLRFCVDTGRISEHHYTEILLPFQTTLRAMWKYQKELIVASSTPKRDLCTVIYHLCTDGSLRWTEKPKQFYKNDVLLKKNILYIFPEALLEQIKKEPGYGAFTQVTLSRALAQENILIKHEQHSYTIKSPSCRVRVYGISFNVLCARLPSQTQ